MASLKVVDDKCIYTKCFLRRKLLNIFFPPQLKWKKRKDRVQGCAKQLRYKRCCWILLKNKDEKE